MALFITNGCINCGHCAKECPNEAIYEPGSRWSLDDGTGLKGLIILPNGEVVNASDMRVPLSDKVYYIVPEKCTNCKGVFDVPQCMVVCPVPENLIPHPGVRESKEEMLIKQAWLNK